MAVAVVVGLEAVQVEQVDGEHLLRRGAWQHGGYVLLQATPQGQALMTYSPNIATWMGRMNQHSSVQG